MNKLVILVVLILVVAVGVAAYFFLSTNNYIRLSGGEMFSYCEQKITVYKDNDFTGMYTTTSEEPVLKIVVIGKTSSTLWVNMIFLGIQEQKEIPVNKPLMEGLWPTAVKKGETTIGWNGKTYKVDIYDTGKSIIYSYKGIPLRIDTALGTLTLCYTNIKIS